MLVIRMQRTGRKGLAHYRVVVQDSRKSASSGSVVSQLGSYDPHTKTAKIDAEKAEFYLKNGAQPSARAAKLLKENGVKLPKWFSLSSKKTRSVKNAEKLRKNQPAPEKEEVADATAIPASEPEVTTETIEESKEETPKTDTAEEKPTAETEEK